MANDSEAKPGSKGEYEVGYGKPPKHSRWKPGQCGNSNGRPLNSRNKKTEYQTVMGKRHRVKINGRMVSRSATEIMLEQAKLKAMNGDLKAVKMLIDLGLKLGALQPVAVDEPRQGGLIVIPTYVQARTAEDQVMLAQMEARQMAQDRRKAEEHAKAEADALALKQKSQEARGRRA